ncbi:HAD family phosphatase [Robertmurraya yapensis]|uniref:HAD family phosphatase n=1 Tax=Bacillus yapensis TaxID=2492960 RepID=A0A3S0II79_9BACI|nr:Cof-type HAD-IIB family hydrolase [Bacillus yapensis]RTR33076.1 HAD family phosphatase [Bacillus yapensis]TKS96899.1 Cof-type HAD-IIB family hydrolase [Bacillus yapensis]
MVKCIAIDMDGTLLTKEHVITEENINAIKKAQEQGVEVVIATGRSYPEAIYILKEAGITCPMICVNGAEVRTPNGEITDFSPLDKAVAKQIVQKLEDNDVYVEFFTSKGIFTMDMEKGISILKNFVETTHSDADAEKVEAILQERVEFITEIESSDFIFADKDHHIYKLLTFSFDSDVLGKVRQELNEVDGIAISSSGKENLEINGIHAQKGLALEAFTAERGISLMETMAIGDNYNDISMFQRVGRAVAMGNADDAVKSQCHFVTATNEESGVGKAILEAIK